MNVIVKPPFKKNRICIISQNNMLVNITCFAYFVNFYYIINEVLAVFKVTVLFC